MSIDFDSGAYIPILGGVALRLGQVAEAAFVADAAVQAGVLAQVSAALATDAVTVGWHTAASVGVDVVRRLSGRDVVALLGAADPGAAREYCEADVSAIFLSGRAGTREMKFKQVGRAAGHYGVPVILAEPERPNAAEFASSVGLAGAIVAEIHGDEPGIVGGGLPGAPPPPRTERFFWTFSGEVPPGLAPEELAALARRLRDKN